jgi:hypothetical protein
MIKIRAIHKSGSTLQNAIYVYINSLCDKKIIEFDRLNIHDKNLETEVKESDIIVLRHPVNRMISHYYSHGWTHNTSEFDNKAWGLRELIQSISLEDFVLSGRLFYQASIYEKIFNNTSCKILRYEDMMNNPRGYILFILKKIKCRHLFGKVYGKFKEEFEFKGKDLSNDIINNGVITHKRNLDHKEYLNKFKDDCQIYFINKIMGDILEKYDKLYDQTIN